jgi:hypothetical protein
METASTSPNAVSERVKYDFEKAPGCRRREKEVIKCIRLNYAAVMKKWDASKAVP